MRTSGIVVVVLIMACAPALYGSVVECQASIAFSGAGPAGPPPWLKIALDDGGTLGSVDFTLEAIGLTGSEFLSKLYFNLDPSLDPDDLSFSGLTKTGQFDSPKFKADADGWNVAGSGRYDVELKFGTSNKGGGTKRFGAGEALSFTMTGPPTLAVSSFDWLSTGGGNGAFPFAAHIQSIGYDDSGWVSGPAATAGVIPEPVTISLVSMGGLALLRKRRRI